MHVHPLERWRHEHDFLGVHHHRNERRTRLVIALTAVTMVVEIAAGLVFGSMALLADGWHMATHAGALALAAAAYAFARKHAQSSRYVFGTGKVGDLAGFTSAVLLAVVAVLIGYESLVRLFAAHAVRFDEALWVAGLGLLVNLACAWLLGMGGHDGEHEHDHAPGSGHAHADHNLRSAYLHVLADALTSVFAIAALLAGKYLGWSWMDPVCGLIGALVILRWSLVLVRAAGGVLLDTECDPDLAARIRAHLEETRDDHVTDLHVWRVGPGRFAAMASLVSDDARAPEHYKQRLAGIACLAHVTIEVNPCPGEHPRVAGRAS
ncbi:MAG: CDF family Co(II)/Ni(II) efflux transporter DmeF [Planctomycetes bacterium]|nr:CDF family Co(II)/Ni(II) efflux transporter DmeF [Planctomycetota bacterium]